MSRKNWSPRSLAAQAMGKVDPQTKGVVPPIHVSTTYIRDEDNGYSSGFIYGRPDNETVHEAQAVLAMLEEAKGVKDQKLKHLIDVYSNMNAKQAAKVLETLDNTIAVKILAGMRGRQAGDVLNNMEAKKAAGLTEMLTSMQLPPQAE